jgi:hypothetical protein
MNLRMEKRTRGGLTRRVLLGLVALATLGAPGAKLLAQHAPAPRYASQEDLRRDFDEAWKAADGPAALRDLELWCAKNKLAAERVQVQKLLSTLTLPEKPAADQTSREAARVERAESRKAVREFTASRSRAAQADLAKLVAWMKAERFAPPQAKERLARFVRELVPGQAERSAALAALSDLEHGPLAPDLERKLDKEFASKFAAFLKPHIERLFFAVDRCLAAGEPGLAFDLYQWLLRIDPDNERARRGLGEARVGDRWLRPFEVDQVKAGLSWDEKLGWIIAKEKPRYDAGDCFDLGGQRWAKLADLNRLHAEPASPWKLRSEHFELFSTADLELSIQVLSRLEAFFLQAFRQYDLFFAGKGSAASLVFGMAPAKKRLTVYFYRDHDQFTKEAKPPVAWAAGFYTSQKHASYFHAQGQSFVESTLQHELTHQILAEYSGGGSPPQWQAEGAAVYLEDAFFQGGTLTLGTLESHTRLATYQAALRAGQKEHGLRDVLRFVTIKDWDSGDIQMNYRGVGAVLYFLMNFDGGRYRGDAIAMLRDAYSGNARPTSDYFGLSLGALDLLMNRFYRDCEPRPAAPGRASADK